MKTSQKILQKKHIQTNTKKKPSKSSKSIFTPLVFNFIRFFFGNRSTRKSPKTSAATLRIVEVYSTPPRGVFVTSCSSKTAARKLADVFFGGGPIPVPSYTKNHPWDEDVYLPYIFMVDSYGNFHVTVNIRPHIPWMMRHGIWFTALGPIDSRCRYKTDVFFMPRFWRSSKVSRWLL